MKTIEFSEDGNKYSDQECMTRAIEFLASDEAFICVSNALFIHSARVRVYEGHFPYSELQFRFKGEILTINKDARFHHRPYGFCDNMEFLMSRLLWTQRKE